MCQGQMHQMGQTVLVTGCAGFIGSWVSLHLLETYPDVIVVGFDALTYCTSPKTIELLSSHERFKFIRGNMAIASDVNELFANYKIDEVVHLAAESHVDHSFADPNLFIQSNIVGTVNLLEALAKHKPNRLVYVSTDEVYGGSSNEVDENTKLTPTNPYAASKASAEMFVHAYARSYTINTVVIRMNNVYGPRQYPEKVIPMFLTRILRGEKCYIHGKGLYSRRYLYVRDAAQAIDTVRTKGKTGETYNAGAETELVTTDLLHQLLKLCGHDPQDPKVRDRFIGHTQDRPYNDEGYPLCSTKISELGWHPRTSIDDGLVETLEFYKTEPDYF